LGIGRRRFLQLFSSTLSALAANPSSAIALVEDYYINKKLGIAFTKPKGWVFADVRQMGEVKRGQLLDLNDPELEREFLEYTELPILTISRDGISGACRDFTPGITVYIDRFSSEEVEQENGGSTVMGLVDDVEVCSVILKEFCVLTPPSMTSVSQCEAAEYTAKFLFEHANLIPTPVRMRTLAIDQGTTLYTIRMFDSPYIVPDAVFDYASFVESIQMV